MQNITSDTNYLRILARASRAFAEAGLDYGKALDVVARVLAEHVAHFCIVRVISADSRWLEAVAVAHRDPARLENVRAASSEALDLRVPLYSETMRQRRLRIFTAPDGNMIPALAHQGYHEYLRTIGISSMLVMPLYCGSRFVGALILGRDGGEPPFSEGDQLLVTELGERAALAIDNARLHKEQTEARILLDRTLDHAPVGFSFIDRDFRFVRVNRTLTRVSGRRPEDFHGRTVREALPHVADRIESRTRQVLETGEPVVSKEPFVTSGQWGTEPRVLVTSSFPIRDDEGRPLGVGTFLTDVTELKGAEAERDLLLARLREALALRDEFILVASHELKTPLTALDLQAALIERVLELGAGRLGDKVVSDNVLEAAAGMKTQIKHLTRLVNDMLDVSRSRSGTFSIEQGEVDLSRLTREVIARVTSCHERVAITLHGESVGPLVLRGDGLRLEQVLTNLLNNALKFGQGKPIEVSLERRGSRVRLAVRDHGIGIAPENLELIFKRFGRVVNGEYFTGMGLGLFISRQIVEAHSGTIHVESTPGLGARFVVELPA